MEGIVWIGTLVIGILIGWLPTYLYYSTKVETMQELLASALAATAKVKVSLAAGLATVEARQVYIATKAALMTAFPDHPDEEIPSPTRAAIPEAAPSAIPVEE